MGSRGTDGGKWSTSRAGNNAGTHSTGDWVGPRRDLGVLENLAVAGIPKTRTVNPAVSSLYGYPQKTLIFLPSFVRSLLLNMNRHLCIPQSVQTGSGAYPVGTGIFSSAGGVHLTTHPIQLQGE